MTKRNWHQKFNEERTFGDRLADYVAARMGSWNFIIIQTIIVVVWMIVNVLGIMYEWDKYPFILLNLLFSTQAAYAAPIIMMSQNRQNAKDRVKAEEDYDTNTESLLQIELLIRKLDKIENDKINRILETLHINVDGVEDSEDIYQEAQRIYPGYGESAERAAFIKGVKWQSKRNK